MRTNSKRLEEGFFYIENIDKNFAEEISQAKNSSWSAFRSYWYAKGPY
jgi:hypothetical protein